MQFMIIAAESDEAFATRKQPDTPAFQAYMASWKTYGTELREAGIHVTSNALEGPETATTVHVRDGKRTVQDGPYADTKEQLGGYCIIDVSSMEEAKKWATRCPSTPTGKTEIRQIMTFQEGA